MKIDKISQKILASVLMLAVLICGMFFLTACGDDDNAELNNRITELQNQLNEANKQAQDLENQLVVSKIINTLFSISANPAKPYVAPLLLVERANSSLGVPYEGNYVKNSSEIEMIYEDYVQYQFMREMQVFAEVAAKTINNDQFKEGELYQDLITSDKVYQFMIKIDKTNKTINMLFKEVATAGENKLYGDMEIKLNDNYTDWVSCKEITNIPTYNKTIFTMERGTGDLEVKSLNAFNISNETGDVDNIYCAAFDTGYCINGGEISTTMAQALMAKYGSELNGVTTKINNAFNGKTVYAQLDVFPKLS